MQQPSGREWFHPLEILPWPGKLCRLRRPIRQHDGALLRLDDETPPLARLLKSLALRVDGQDLLAAFVMFLLLRGRGIGQL